MQGKLIVFEGGEGCGKTTQLQQLAPQLQQWLTAAGTAAALVQTREPGGTALGGHLRQILLDQELPLAIAPPAELLLYAADRAQHVETVIRPALAQGSWVLCDRFIDSTVAYQGYGRGLDLELIEQLNAIATGGLVPDLVLWLQLEVEQGLARSHRRGQADRIEQADLAFHQRVQQGFEAQAQAYPERIVAIDAAGDRETVQQRVRAVVQQAWEQWRDN